MPTRSELLELLPDVVDKLSCAAIAKGKYLKAAAKHPAGIYRSFADTPTGQMLAREYGDAQYEAVQALLDALGK